MSEENIGGMGRRGKPLGTLDCRTDIIHLMRSLPNPTDKEIYKQIENDEFFVKSEKAQKSFYKNIMSCILNAYHKLAC